MATLTENVTVATVLFLAQDKNAPKAFQNVLVGKFEDVLIPSGEDSSMTVLKLAMTGKVQEMLDTHNKQRVEMINQSVLERTGTEVKLQPLSVEDLQIQIKS